MSRILIGEDDPSIGDLLSIILKMDQHEVALATSKKDILHQLGEFTPDLILMDIMLNGENGMDICKHLKIDHHDIKVILISANYEMLYRYHECEADAIIEKPFNIKDLVAIVNKELSRIPEVPLFQ